MDLQQIHDIVTLIADDKSMPDIFVDEDFDDALHYAQLKYFKQRLGLPEEYQPGMPYPKIAFEITKRITEDLRPFKVIKGWGTTTPLQLNNGHLEYPSDYYIASSITYSITKGEESFERRVDILSDQEYEEKTTSVLMKPGEMFPVANMQSAFIRFFPLKNEKINMVYLRMPKKPRYAVKYYEDWSEYWPEQSVQLEWDDMATIDIITIMLSELGIMLKNQLVLEYAEKVKERGI